MRYLLVAAALALFVPCVVDAQDIYDQIANPKTGRPIDAYLEGKRQREEQEREEARLRLERQRVEMERQRQQEAQRLERERLRLEEEQMRFRMEEAKESHRQNSGGDGELDLLEKLTLLGKLRDDNVISETEFELLKADVMAKYGPGSDERSSQK